MSISFHMEGFPFGGLGKNVGTVGGQMLLTGDMEPPAPIAAVTRFSLAIMILRLITRNGPPFGMRKEMAACYPAK